MQGMVLDRGPRPAGCRNGVGGGMTYPTVCVFSFVPGRSSVSGRLLFNLPVYTGLGLHYPQSRKPAFLPMVMNLKCVWSVGGGSTEHNFSANVVASIRVDLTSRLEMRAVGVVHIL